MKQLQEILKPYFVEWQIEPDITAVLKYINSKWYVEPLIDADYMYFARWIHILNKPLHLYDANEEENLLKLLLKLK